MVDIEGWNSKKKQKNNDKYNNEHHNNYTIKVKSKAKFAIDLSFCLAYKWGKWN